jgi:hypothetical protein
MPEEVYDEDNDVKQHWPNLKSLLMIEKAIKDAEIPPRKTELWGMLPKGMMYQTFCKAIDYLQASGKILIDKEGRVVWIAADNPELVRLMNEAVNL